VLQLAATCGSTGSRWFAALAQVVDKTDAQRHFGVHCFVALLSSSGLLLALELGLRLRAKEGRPGVLQLSLNKHQVSKDKIYIGKTNLLLSTIINNEHTFTCGKEWLRVPPAVSVLLLHVVRKLDQDGGLLVHVGQVVVAVVILHEETLESQHREIPGHGELVCCPHCPQGEFELAYIEDLLVALGQLLGGHPETESSNFTI
jgi:hypothetical protein